MSSNPAELLGVALYAIAHTMKKAGSALEETADLIESIGEGRVGPLVISTRKGHREQGRRAYEFGREMGAIETREQFHLPKRSDPTRRLNPV
jgi:hypothetical protein